MILALATAVAEISLIKKASNPMIGSKVLHFLLPEFFPVWDMYWIKKKALRNYQDRYDRLPPEVGRKLAQLGKVKGEVFVRAAKEYAAYVTLMLEESSKTSDGDLQKIVKKCLWEGDIEREVVDVHFQNRDISPMIFEVCLLGKHC